MLPRVLVLASMLALFLASFIPPTAVSGGSSDVTIKTFQLLLGKLYEAAGLLEQAAEAFDEARFLMTGPTKQ